MTKKKILHIVESFGSGVFSFLTDLVDETANDFDITIAFGQRDETPENYAEYFPKNVKFIKVNNFGRSINPTKDFKAFKEVKGIIKQVKPDIIHLHSSKAGFIGRFATNCKKTKVLYNPHGFSFLMKNNSALKRKMYWFIEKVATVNHATIVGCSYGEYEEAVKISRRSICINNGINIGTMKKMTENIEPHKFNTANLSVCTCARIGFQKQPDVFNSVAKLQQNTQFTWVGDGELKDLLTAKNIKVTGWLPKSEVLKILNDNDIFILTSAWEGLPLSLLEAMYLGKICVVSNCIGNKDVIKNGENGFICNNAEEFSATLNKIKNMTEDELNKISATAKADVEKNYDVRKNVKEKYVAQYLN